MHGEHEGPFFSVTAMICWSKNPAEHRHSPTRVALGAPPAAFPGHAWTCEPSFQKPGFALHCESEVAPAGLGEVLAGHRWTFDLPSFQKPGFALHCERWVAPAGLGEVFAGHGVQHSPHPPWSPQVEEHLVEEQVPSMDPQLALHPFPWK